MINMFCPTFYLILIITLIISGLGDINLHWRLKAMLETFLKDSYSKTYIDHYNFVFCTFFTVLCCFSFLLCCCVLTAGFYTLNWIDFCETKNTQQGQGLGPGPHLWSLHRSSRPIPGGEGTSCPSPRILPPTRPFGPRSFVPPHFWLPSAAHKHYHHYHYHRHNHHQQHY